MSSPFGGAAMLGRDYIPPAPKAGWDITHPGQARPVNPGFAARLFSSGDPLEGGLLDPSRAKGYGNRAILDAGLNILQHSGPAPFRTGLAQLLAGGVKAGQQSYLDSTKQGVAVDDIIKQREQAARLGVLRAKYAGKSDIQSQQQLLSELLTNGFTREADSLAGFLSNAINQQGRGASAANLDITDSADGTERIARDKLTGKEVWRQPLGQKPKGITEYQQDLAARADRAFNAQQLNALADDWNRRITPIRDTHETILRALALKDAALRGSGAARNQMIVAFVKSIDPGSVAREGEVDLARSLANLQDQARGYVDAAGTGVSPKIPEGLVREIATTLESNAKWFGNRWGTVRKQYLKRAGLVGLSNVDELFDTPPSASASSDAAARARALGQ